MPDRPSSQLPLRELLTHAEKLSRDLVEHLEKSFLPRIHSLEELVQPQPDGDLTQTLDVTVRNHANEVLMSDEFMQKACATMDDYLAAIDAGMEQHGNPS